LVRRSATSQQMNIDERAVFSRPFECRYELSAALHSCHRNCLVVLFLLSALLLLWSVLCVLSYLVWR
jgi:hypothetical protein